VQSYKLRRGYTERNLAFQMGYMFRGNPAMRWIRKAVQRGWLGEIFEIQGSMSHHYGGAAYQEYIGRFRGGIMFNLGCHLIDFVASVMGRPERVVPFLKSGPGQPGHVKNNGLTILEYPHATVTLRACSLEVDGLQRRRLKICGTKGSVDLCPLERIDCGQPLRMDLLLQEGNEEYEAGTHTVDFGKVRDRYEDQLLEFARVIRGETPNPYDDQHDILVQEILLAASGYTDWQ
jgi:predicted dehydrogenase